MIAQCVTNVLRDFEPCVTPGEHLPDCHDEECEGCWPARPVSGHLCRACWVKVEWALGDWSAFLTLLGGESRAVTPELSSHGHAGPRWPFGGPLPADLDKPRRLFASNPGSLSGWVATETGAADAVRFVRAVDHLTAMYPVDEAPTILRSLKTAIRCPQCHEASVKRIPPLVDGHDVRFLCVRAKCRHELSAAESTRVILQLAGADPCCRSCEGAMGCVDTDCSRCHARRRVEPWEQESHGRFEPTEPLDRARLGYTPVDFDWSEFDGREERA